MIGNLLKKLLPQAIAKKPTVMKAMPMPNAAPVPAPNIPLMKIGMPAKLPPIPAALPPVMRSMPAPQPVVPQPSLLGKLSRVNIRMPLPKTRTDVIAAARMR